MAESTGEDKPTNVPRGRAASSILLHRIVVLAVLIAVLLAIILVPEQSQNSASTAPTAQTRTESHITILPGMTPPNAPGSPGIAVSGVKCGPKVRQVKWSAYAPLCEPKWTGSNGGATYKGVTGKTITISYRAATTQQLAYLYALVPPGAIGTNAEEESTMQAYINTFNKNFELYGRKVKLVPFTGQGDFITEDLGKDQTQAQSDAVNVGSNLKAFADMSLVDSSAVYSSDLAGQHVIASSLYEDPASFYSEFAPWEYTPGPNCTKMALATSEILGKQLGGLPASLAGDAATRAKKRVFGMIYPQNVQSAKCATEDATDMKNVGQPITTQATVAFKLSTIVPNSTQAVARMKASGITTIIVNSADPITPTFLMDAAKKINYYPEWWFQSYFPDGQTNTDTLANLFARTAPTQVDQIFGAGNEAQPLNKEEAVRAYKLGAPNKSVQQIPSFAFTYQSLLQFFDALQLAGPDLTPANFEEAMKSIPVSAPGGMFGGWNGKVGAFDPESTYSIVKFDHAAPNPLDGKAGAFIWCDGGKKFSYLDGGKDVPAHQQITCPAPPARLP